MGRVGKLQQFVRDAFRSRAQFDQGGGDIRTGDHFAPPGDDSQPLAGDKLVAVQLPQTGVPAVLGYVDTRNAPQSGPGERRMYARNADGDPMAWVWLRSSGAVEITNGAGSIVLGASGTVTINGVTIDPAGNVDVPAQLTAQIVEAVVSMLAAGKELVLHKHSDVTPGSGTSGPNV